MNTKTRSVSRETRLVLALAVVRLAFRAYRAAHQSLTVDEAFSHSRFLTNYWAIWGPYDANNHVLFSILAKLSIDLFGLSEFSLRLPTLIGGFFMTLGV